MATVLQHTWVLIVWCLVVMTTANHQKYTADIFHLYFFQPLLTADYFGIFVNKIWQIINCTKYIVYINLCNQINTYPGMKHTSDCDRSFALSGVVKSTNMLTPVSALFNKHSLTTICVFLLRNYGSNTRQINYP